MKGLICGIKRMEIHDGDGLRTTVFFKGCPLKCIWCHNPESISPKKQLAFFEEKCIGCGSCNAVCPNEAIKTGIIDNSKCGLCLECEKVCPTGAITLFGEEYEAEELANILMQDALFFKNSGGGVTLSGGECLFQPEFAVALAKILKENGISVYVDTCGFVSREVLKKIIPYTDKFLYDVKAIDSDVHKNCTGRENSVILENLEYLLSKNCAVEIRYPLVVGYNDGECEKIGKWLSDRNATCKVKVLQYHPFASSRYKALDMENTLPNTKTEPSDVEKAVEILKSYGIPAINGITEQ